MALSYPVSAPRKTHHVLVGQGHQLEIEEHGSGDGLPVIVCHGGPGGGLSRFECAHFNPEHYRILLFSQRGCGNSTPHSCEHNTLEHLIGDLECIRRHLGIGRWVVCGESFGATLAMVYALRHREHVSALMLWASFFASQQDYDWCLGKSGAGAQFYPEYYRQFNPQNQPTSALIEGFHQQLFSDSEPTQLKAAKAWVAWEETLCCGTAPSIKLLEPAALINRAQLQLHYFKHQFFLRDDMLMDHAKEFAGLPVWMVHGRHDLMCSYARAQAFATAAQAHLDIFEGLGHSLADEVYCQAQCRATDHMYLKLKRQQCKD
ncbi:alpha/beta fold hydrolase [Pseudoalteromonas ruthenica]|uniref:alpha/beta fold hydrolase n=1 Tax=Pseudoalteromonas ruthenica TaxID=151081 RepID=UPI00110B2F6C|nr:alpha/beta fold hydrolase [Pseudoalteromonas ruthenica]TMO46335.1 proline iminopeptidase [Pseudoalteromonas ruthenica]TMO50494.1 proline iminopeptidase [Pseudoalteromonas ruthenica]